MSQPATSLSIINGSGTLNFNSIANYNCTASSYTVNTNNKYSVISNNDIINRTETGNLYISSDVGIITLNSTGSYNNAITIEATNSNGGILQTAGSGGINSTTSNGQINLLSQGSDINIGVTPSGTPANLQTQNLNLESFNNFNVNSGDMYFVSSDVISFVSTTGDIQFGATSDGAPVLKFENGNILVNQTTSNLDYQLDIAISDSSNSKNGYNGIVINSIHSNVAADLTLQTSNTLGDKTQCILSLGSFGSNNNQSIFQKYLVYQTGNTVIRLDSTYYSPNSIGDGNDFLHTDIGRQIYWPTIDRLDTITGLSTFITPTNDTANVTVHGTYTGNTSSIYLLQIDSLSTPNTFMWSNNGGVSFQQYYVPIINTTTPILLDNGLSVLFSRTTDFSYNQQFTFKSKITALVTNATSIPIPQTMYTLQQFYSYISTTTPSDIVINTNNNEKMRITADGSISIQKQLPTASLDLDSNYNKVLLVNENISGYQINPSISYLESGGYVIVWNSQDQDSIESIYNFDIYGQRYMSDGSRYAENFKINNITSNNQSYPSVAGNKVQNSNHYIVAWGSNQSGNGYNVYFQVFQNNKPLSTIDKLLDSTASPSSNKIYPRCAGLYNGNYIVVWSADENNSGIYAVNAAIIGDDIDSTFIRSKFLINIASPSLSRNYPYVAGLPSDDNYYPNGFVVSYMTAIDNNNENTRYNISLRVFNYNGIIASGEIPITSVGSTAYSSISDGLLSIAEINKHNVNTNNLNLGNFILTFYRNYLADASLYNIGDSVSGLISGSTASIAATYPSQRIITLQNLSNRFLVSEEINIVSSNSNVSITIEQIAAITFITNTTANITLNTGSKDVMAYCFKSNVSQVSDAIWSTQVNTSLLYSDLDRLSGDPSVFSYKRPLSAVTVDGDGNALITWSNGSIPSVYYQLIDSDTGNFISTEQRLTSQYNGLKQRDQVVSVLQSIEGNSYGFVISWDNQSLDLQSTGIYQQLIGYGHSLFALSDGNCSLTYNHQNQLGVGTVDPTTTLHMKSQLSSSYNDPVNTCTLTIQNTCQHVITKQPLQSINFVDGLNNTLNTIQSVSSLRYDDLYPQPTNLVGFYKFDHSEGTQVIDYSSASTNLNIFNEPVYINTNGILNNFDVETCWVPGIVNNSLEYDGNNNYVYVEANALNNLNTLLEGAPNKMSLSLWVNVPSNVVVNSTYDIVSNGGNLALAGTYLLSLRDLTNNGKMVVTSNIIVNGVKNIGIIGTTKINDAKWHHIVETVDLSSGTNCIISLYVDGLLQNTVNTTGVVNLQQHSTIRTYFGSRNGISNFFRGNMDEFRFYKSILSTSEISNLYKYGNPNLPPNSTMILSPNTNASHNQSIIIDNNGKINNLSSRPLPYTVLSGEIIAYNNNLNITGINGTNFLNELTVGDIIVLDISQDIEFTVISIIDNYNATIDKRGYSGTNPSKQFQSVLRRPSIYTFFDNSDSIRGHIDNYGNMIIGASKPSTMMEISGYSYNSIINGITNLNNIPELSITNLTQENTQYGRMTAINFKCYDSSNLLNVPLQLGRIETSHNGTNIDEQGIMKLSVNNGTTLNTLISLTSNGNIGIGGGTSGNNNPLTLIHALNQSTSIDCELLLQSNYNASPTEYSIFDERSDLYFGGLSSSGNTINSNIKHRVLSSINGSNDSNTKELDGRLDFLTNNHVTDNGIESRMSITHVGNVGVSIIQPFSTFQVAPELRLSLGQLNTISSTTSDGAIITLSQNIFSSLSTPQRNLYVGGCIVIENSVLTTATILSVNPSVGNQLTVNSNLSTYVNSVIHVHPAGLNVIGTGASTGYTGVNTTTPTSVLSVNGSLSLPILLTTTNLTLDLTHYTVICNTTSNSIIITLPANSIAITGRIYVIKKRSGSNTCTVRTTDSSQIDGSTSQTITNFTHVQSDGTNWWRINYS